jgi:hypothetical protein
MNDELELSSGDLLRYFHEARQSTILPLEKRGDENNV